MDFYGKQEAKIISGIAIVMMLTHHFFGFSEYLLSEIQYTSIHLWNGITVERVFAAFGKLCVAIFAFNSGYVLWKSKENSSLKKISKRLITFLSSYWFICFLFIGYGVCFHEQLPDIKTFLNNLFGLKTDPHAPYINVVFGWYVAFYISWLLVSPLLLKIFENSGGAKKDLFWLVGICITLKFLYANIFAFNFLTPIPSAICGLLIAKYRIFEKVYERIHLSPIVALLVIALIIPCRQGLIYMKLNQTGIEDGIFASLFIFVIIIIIHNIKMAYVNKVLLILGTYSMNIWYLHGLFFTGNNKLQWILYSPKYPLLILIWGIILLLPLSIVCSLFYEKLTSSMVKILKISI